MILTVTLNAAIDNRYRMKKLRLGEVNRVSLCQCSAGGKGLNVARVAAIAGESVTAFGVDLQAAIRENCWRNWQGRMKSDS